MRFGPWRMVCGLRIRRIGREVRLSVPTACGVEHLASCEQYQVHREGSPDALVQVWMFPRPGGVAEVETITYPMAEFWRALREAEAATRRRRAEACD